jgi:hypothetical protein
VSTPRMNYCRLSEYRAMVSELLRRAPHTLLATWAVVIFFLIGLPVALTLGREPWFDATIEAGAGAQVSPAVLGATVRRLVRDPIVEQSTIADAHLVINQEDLEDRITVAPSARGVLIRVRGRTPEGAGSLADVLRSKLSQAATRERDLRLVLGHERVSRLGFLDRVVDALPGAFPRRNGPAWIAVAGFVAAAVVCTGLTLFWEPPAQRGPRS